MDDISRNYEWNDHSFERIGMAFLYIHDGAQNDYEK